MLNNSNLKSLFYLNPEITYLNFGSFGACPKPIFENYQQWQLELEQEPAQFFTVNATKYLEHSRKALSQFINCDKDDLVYVSNPSYAVNTIAKSLDLKRDDEILTTHIEYGACDKAWKYYCDKSGAKYVQQKITFPIESKEKFIEEFFAGLNSKTRMIFISHITSSTALILPVHEICEIAKQKGLFTFVDGAHAPGHVDLDLQKLKADFYTGACHKWMLTPKGCSFLYVKKEYQKLVDPLVVSWGYNALFPSHSQFLDYHQMQGTRDFSAFLTVPKAIEFMQENNWKQVSEDCKKLVLENAHRFCELLNTKAISPITHEFIGQMFSIPISTKEPEALQRLLFNDYKIEIPVMRLENNTFLRYSINAFNAQEDLDKLFYAVEEIREKKNLIE